MTLCCGTSKYQARKAQLASALVPAAALVRERPSDRPSTGLRPPPIDARCTMAARREPATRVVPAENPPRPESVVKPLQTCSGAPVARKGWPVDIYHFRHGTCVKRPTATPQAQPSCTSHRCAPAATCSGPADRSSQVKSLKKQTTYIAT